MRSYLNDNEEENGPASAGSTQSRRLHSWLEWKEEGKKAYEKGDFEESLESYRTALRPEYECPTKADQAVLWSNVVACRLQLVEKSDGTRDLAQARAAVEDAKQCVSLNPNWAKGHLRLASAYIALGGHSNDACNALQSTIRIDPGNSTAKQMLVRELRRDHAAAAAAASAANDSTDDSVRDPPSNPDFVPGSSGSTTQASGNSTASVSSQNTSFASSAPPEPRYSGAHNSTASVDDGLTWGERLSFQATRVSEWYNGLNRDLKTCIKLVIVVLLLYFAFGGRFGLSGLTNTTTRSKQRSSYHRSYEDNDPAKTSRGNYGSNNAYEQYYQQKQRNRAYDHQDRNEDSYFQSNTHYDSYYEPPRRSSGGGGFRLSNLFDGSIQSMLILAGIAYVAHRNGINPFQAIMLLNLVGGGGRRGYYGGRGRYGGGYGYGRRRRGW